MPYAFALACLAVVTAVVALGGRFEWLAATLVLLAAAVAILLLG